MAKDKPKGKGPRGPKRFIGPRLPDAGRGSLPDPTKPPCGKPYTFRGITRKCGKRGWHAKCGPGK